MDFDWWLQESVSRTRADGLEGMYWSAKRVYYKLLQQHSRLGDPGNYVYNTDWDLLVVLDACRLDLMREVAADYDFIGSISKYRSRNSVTRLWMQDNFGPEFADETADTAYISGNPWSADKLDETAFGHLRHVWQDAWVDPGTTPPEAVTDETIRIAREGNYDRVIAHYMQPHCPFLSEPSLGSKKDSEHFGNQPEGDVWDALERDDVSRDEVWDAYRDNLRLVLNDLRRLLRNIDAPQTIITADHGNALGAWGVYGHQPNMGLDCLRSVPWIKTTAEDTSEADPDPILTDHGVNQEEQLEALGYL